MKRRIGATFVAVLLGGVSLFGAEQRGNDRAKQESPQAPDRVVVQSANRVAVSTKDVNITFSRRDVQVIREHYGPRFRKLPKGLQKKLTRTGHLPPGWQRDIEPFPIVLERQLVALPAGYRRGVIDGNAIIYSPRTQIIIDATVLF
jgi:hypothetical protein